MAQIRPEDWASPAIAPGLADRLYANIPVTTPTAPTTGGTIATLDANGVPIGGARLAPAGAITGMILQAGESDGQTFMIRNISAFSITFAAVATSNVADGVSAVVPALTAIRFIWDATAAYWLHEGL